MPIASFMGVSTLRSNASRQSPYLQIDDPASHPSQRRIYPSPSSPSLSSARASSSRSVTPPVNTICSVLCMYDFHSDDPDHLPFAKNEILDIVKQGDNGWWAALRKGGRVGWIPEAFVNTLSAEVAEKLRNTREELRIYEYDAEQLYISAPTRRIHHLSDTGEGSSSSSSSTRHDAHDDMNQTSRRRIHPKRHSPSASDPDPSSHSVLQRLQRSRDEPPPSYPSHLPRSASSNLTPSLSTDQKVVSSQTRDRAGSLPTHSRSFKQRSIPVKEFSGSTRSSTSKELSDTNHVPKIASTADDGLSDLLVKRSRSQKLKQAMGFVDTRSPPAEPQSAVPWALQPAYPPEEVVTDSNGIIWGTLDALVNRLTTGGLTRDPIKAADETKYRNAFLMTFRTFTTADTLFNMLIQRYRMETPDDLTIAAFEEWRTHAIAIQRSVFTIFTMWLAEHRLLEEEPHIAQRMATFLRLIVMPPLSTMAQNLMQMIERLTFTIPGDASPKTPRRRRKPYPHKNDLLKLYTTDVAEQLTLLEFKLYARVTPQQCIRHTTTPSTRSDSDLFVFCSTHDKLAAWVKTSILNHTALGKRADTVDFWIKIAEKCKQLNNLSTMSAVINALSSTVISSLTLTWAYVGRKPTLDGLLRHNEPTGGFSGYRNLLQNVDGPCVPFIGMYLTDLVHVQDQFSDEGGRICFLQKLKWYETVSAILRYQSKPYDIHENDTTLKFIEERLRENSNKDPNWFWSRSHEIQETEITDADLRKGLEAAGF